MRELRPIALALLVFLANGYSRTLSAQGSPTGKLGAEIFKETTTLVVLDGRDIAFDALLEDAVKKHWTITPHRVVTSEEFMAHRTDSSYSFLMVTQTKFIRDELEHSYHFFNLLLSHPTGDLNEMPVLSHVPFLGAKLSSSIGITKTATLVKFIQNHASDIIENPSDKKVHNLKYLNRSIRELENKTLMVSAEQLEPKLRDLSTLKGAYKHSIKLVSPDEVQDAIVKPKEGIVVLHIVSPDITESTTGECFKMIIEPYSGQAFYYKTHTISSSKPNTFLRGDFRRLRRPFFHWL